MQEDVTIRPLKLRSILAFNRLFIDAVEHHFTYFPQHYRQAVIHQHNPRRLLVAAIHPRRIILTASLDHKLIGYAIGQATSNGTGQLFWLYVDPAQRGKNIGLQLLSQMIKYQRRIGAVKMALATHNSRRYYQRQGFKYKTSYRLEKIQMDVLTYDLKR